MAKLIKFGLRLIGALLEWSLILLIFLAFAIRSYTFQTWLGTKATAYLSDELKTTVKVKQVAIIFFDRLALDGVVLLDQKKDTIASLGSVFVTLNQFKSAKRYIDVKEVNLKNGVVKINRDKKDGEFNFQFISDYFASSDTTTSPPYRVDVRNIRLTRVNLNYDDFRKPYAPFGMDYDHIGVSNLYLSASLALKKSGGISSFIRHISFHERNGFDLNRFSGKVDFDDQGLQIKYLNIATPNSTIYFPKLALLTNSADDWGDFVTKVRFDVELKPSQVNLKDISYFATALEGMDQVLHLSTKVSKTINNLRIADLDLKTGDRTMLKGTFNLIDFSKMDQAFLDQKLQYAYLDLRDIQKVNLPKSSGQKRLDLGSMVNKLRFVELKDLRLDGFYSQFVLKSDHIRTALGSIDLANGVMFTENKAHNSFTFERSAADARYDVAIDSFQIGKFIGDPSIGSLTADFYLDGEIFSNGKIDFNEIQGDLHRFDYNDYAYQNIEIINGTFRDMVFDGQLDIKDDNLNLAYDGLLDLNTKQRFIFTIDINKAILDNLNLAHVDDTRLKSKFEVNITGTDPSNYSGEIGLQGFVYSEGDKVFAVPDMRIKMQRSKLRDELTIDSDVASASINGKVDFGTIADELQNQFNKILPALFKAKTLPKKRPNNEFEYDVTFKDVNAFLNIFVPGLTVAPNTRVKGRYEGLANNFSLDLISDKIQYENTILSGIQIEQCLTDTLLSADYTASMVQLNDSLAVKMASFKVNGTKGEFDSELSWNPGMEDASFFSWKTIVNDLNSFFVNLNPGYFSVRHHHWDIVNNSQILISPEDIKIQHFKMQRGKQFLSINGEISKRNEDILKIEINDLELEDFVSLFSSSTKVSGTLDGVTTISNPFTNLVFSCDTKINELFLNEVEIGDIALRAGWDQATNSVTANGELFYRKNKTFNFEGNYYTDRTKNSLDFDLDFDYTDLNFANAFLPKEVISGMRGLLLGKIHVGGTPELPEIEGVVDLQGGNIKVEMLGVNFGYNGEIIIEKDAILINNMPLMDEDGNTGSLVGTVFHQNFDNWNFDLLFNLEDDADAVAHGLGAVPLQQFLLMNTAYKDGELYYGKAYATGIASISGYADNMSINVDMVTKPNTTITFPMYGFSDLNDESAFLKLCNGDCDSVDVKEKLNLSGIDMNMNFKVTPEATVRVEFNPDIGDVITTHGRGDISIGVGQLGDVEMVGTYTIENTPNASSAYNFAMGPVKQIFNIAEGGTISWTGDPINARMNIKTYTTVKTSMAEISTNLRQESAQVKEVNCLLTMTETLLAPTMTFDIEVPRANDDEKSALNRIRSNPDDLNKQFFSLLLFKKFQPLHGKMSAGSGAAYDILEAQMNEVLNQIKEVNVGVDLNGGGATVKLEKNIGRINFRTNLGVESSSTGGGSQGQSTMVGDVAVEYLVNEEGTFRLSVFNESNDNTVIQEKTQGQFTQGGSISYQEDFNNFQDFKLAQYFLDVFRKKDKKRYPIKRKRKLTKVPPIDPAKKPE